MGYDINSPIKQVWLPLDYTFIDENSVTARDFIEAYKEKYGIDLHNLFELVSVQTNFYSIRLKEKLIGAYCANETIYQSTQIINLANPFAVEELSPMQYVEGGTDDVVLLKIGLLTNDRSIGFGFAFVCKNGDQPKTIDDLKVQLFEL